ncbi:hypothetical protein QTJ16_005369 [Diplocarpon rosae]|uniref:Uncharacterized protein n=1 Tax=Diplocarpon rosae TaxID=946125 RepID=A0AAD9SWK9_9HELO|nr:hypothetical protein QTJ16_005369 [Diplocarpon rosae]PBP15450.1 hypothetical protein BUE80_DR013816 [Diplocarpon rosae]
MPPPPVTPSPHRFVIKEERPPLAKETNPGPSNQQQFNATPRFTFSSTPRPTASQTLSRLSSSAVRYLTPGSRTSKQNDAIELSSDDEPQHVHESTESERQDFDLEGYNSTDLEDYYRLEDPSPKRRCLSTSPISVVGEIEGQQGEPELHGQDNDGEPPSSLRILSSPPSIRRPISSTAPRFLFSIPAPESTPKDQKLATQISTPFLKPPRFRLPDHPETSQTQIDPLPEQFSPCRRGQKYIAGGLATEVRDWLMNLEGAIPTTEDRRVMDGEWLVRILIDEISGGSKEGMTLVRGRQTHVLDNDGEGGGQVVDTLGIVKVMLAGEEQAIGLQKGSRAEVGKTVGIKGPVWEVVVEGEKWGVGVEWKVLA